MEEPLASQPGRQQVLVLGDEVLNDLLLQASSLEKHQQAFSFHTANGLYSQAYGDCADSVYGNITRQEMCGDV